MRSPSLQRDLCYIGDPACVATIGAARVLRERSNRAARAPAGVCVVAGRSQGGGRRPDRSDRERRADGVIAGVAKRKRGCRARDDSF